MAGFVYLLKECGDDSMYKIGVTKASDIDKRIKKLQTGNGNKIICLKTFETSRPYKMEKMLHFHYGLNREEGEWFLLPPSVVDEFIPLCEQFERNIKVLEDNPFF